MVTYHVIYVSSLKVNIGNVGGDKLVVGKLTAVRWCYWHVKSSLNEYSRPSISCYMLWTGGSLLSDFLLWTRSLYGCLTSLSRHLAIDSFTANTRTLMKRTRLNYTVITYTYLLPRWDKWAFYLSSWFSLQTLDNTTPLFLTMHIQVEI